MNNEQESIISKEERKEVISILKDALVTLGTKDYKYSVNLSVHMLYNYFRNKDVLCGVINLRNENREIFRYQSNWVSNSYYQGGAIRPYLAKIEKILGADRYKLIIKELASKV